MVQLEVEGMNKWEIVFTICCVYGDYIEAKTVYECAAMGAIDISLGNERAFRLACKSANVELVYWLLRTKPDINIAANNDEAFRTACEMGAVDIARIFEGYNPAKYVFYAAANNNIMYWEVVVQDKQTTYREVCLPAKVIDAPKPSKKPSRKPVKINCLTKASLPMCEICFNNSVTHKTNCNHSFCYRCITEWLNCHCLACPFCRETIVEITPMIC
jgi:hypothetical protein